MSFMSIFNNERFPTLQADPIFGNSGLVLPFITIMSLISSNATCVRVCDGYQRCAGRTYR